MFVAAEEGKTVRKSLIHLDVLVKIIFSGLHRVLGHVRGSEGPHEVLVSNGRQLEELEGDDVQPNHRQKFVAASSCPTGGQLSLLPFFGGRKVDETST